MRISDRQGVRAMSVGLEIASMLKKLYPEKFESEKLMILVGNAETIRQLQAGTPAQQIVASWSGDLASFERLRRTYFLYK